MAAAAEALTAAVGQVIAAAVAAAVDRWAPGAGHLPAVVGPASGVRAWGQAAAAVLAAYEVQAGAGWQLGRSQ